MSLDDILGGIRRGVFFVPRQVDKRLFTPVADYSVRKLPALVKTNIRRVLRDGITDGLTTEGSNTRRTISSTLSAAALVGVIGAADKLLGSDVAIVRPPIETIADFYNWNPTLATLSTVGGITGAAYVLSKTVSDTINDYAVAFGRSIRSGARDLKANFNRTPIRYTLGTAAAALVLAAGGLVWSGVNTAVEEHNRSQAQDSRESKQRQIGENKTLIYDLQNADRTLERAVDSLERDVTALGTQVDALEAPAEADLSGYVKKDEVSGLVPTPTPVDLSGYVTDDELDQRLEALETEPAPDATAIPVPAPTPTSVPKTLPVRYEMDYGDILTWKAKGVAGLSAALGLPSSLLEIWTNGDSDSDLELRTLVVDRETGTVTASRLQGNRLYTDDVPGSGVAERLTDYLIRTGTDVELDGLSPVE